MCAMPNNLYSYLCTVAKAASFSDAISTVALNMLRNVKRLSIFSASFIKLGWIKRKKAIVSCFSVKNSLLTKRTFQQILANIKIIYNASFLTTIKLLVTMSLKRPSANHSLRQ